MINNESLFDMFVSRRARGFRSGWSTPRWASSPVTQVLTRFVHESLVSPPEERITERDVLDDSRYDNCGDCGEYDYAAMLLDGVCGNCLWRNEREWRETMAAIDRAERIGMSIL